MNLYLGIYQFSTKYVTTSTFSSQQLLLLWSGRKKKEKEKEKEKKMILLLLPHFQTKRIILYIYRFCKQSRLVVCRVKGQTQNNLVTSLFQQSNIENKLVCEIVANHGRSYGAGTALVVSGSPDGIISKRIEPKKEKKEKKKLTV